MRKAPFLLAMLLILLLAAGCASQPAPENTATINTTGIGKITTQPDTVEVRLSIITEGKDKKVQEENASKTQKAIDALLALGLEKGELETQNVSFQPIYRWHQDKGQQLIGYRAENTLLVKTRKLDKASAVIDTAVKNGAEMVGNLNFSLSDEGQEALMEQAIEKAVQDAKTQAEAAAQAAGVKIAGIQTINVLKNSSPPPILYDMRLAKDEGAPAPDTPVMPAEAEYIITVQAAFIIK